jgi:hypothetical protein
MNKVEEMKIMWYNMNMTLCNLNEHFAKNDTMTSKEFMDIQQNTWNETKKEYNIKIKKGFCD